MPPQPPPGELRSAVLEQLQAQQYAPFEQEIVATFGLPAPALRAAFTRLCDHRALVPGPFAGSRVLTTEALSDAGVIITDLAPGTEIAQHGHTGIELTYVLAGHLIELGQRDLRAGDLLVAKPGDVHALRVANTGRCLVVFSNRTC